MSATTSPLPVGWSKILDEVHIRLDHALASANARIEQMQPVDAAVLPQEPHREIKQWTERLQRLSAFLESAEQVVQSVDEVLQKEETQLREFMSTSGTLRRRLAEGTGRAIG